MLPVSLYNVLCGQPLVVVEDHSTDGCRLVGRFFVFYVSDASEGHGFPDLRCTFVVQGTS